MLIFMRKKKKRTASSKRSSRYRAKVKAKNRRRVNGMLNRRLSMRGAKARNS